MVEKIRVEKITSEKKCVRTKLLVSCTHKGQHAKIGFLHMSSAKIRGRKHRFER